MNPARNFLVFFLLPLFFSSTVYAGVFYGIKPGRSSRADAEKVLGAPSGVSPLGEWAEYRGANFDAEKIIVHYRLGNPVVEKIDIYPAVHAARDDYREWLSLADAAEVRAENDGSRMEIYPASGVALKLGGPAGTDKVLMLTHFAVAGSAAGSQAEETPQPSQKNYLGIELLYEEGGILVVGVHPGSPAERANLAAGDKIVGSGRMRFQSAADFQAVLQGIPPGHAIHFWIERNKKVYETRIPLGLKSPAEIQAIGDRQQQIRSAQEREAQAAAEASAQQRRQAASESLAQVVSLVKQQLIDPIEN